MLSIQWSYVKGHDEEEIAVMKLFATFIHVGVMKVYILVYLSTMILRVQCNKSEAILAVSRHSLAP